MIIINDGSEISLENLKLLNNYLSNEKIIYIELNKNYGVSFARNIGIIYSMFPDIFNEFKYNILKKEQLIKNNNKYYLSNLDICIFDDIFKKIDSSYLNEKEKFKKEFISFLDSDDLFLPKKIEDQISFMKENNYLISHTNEFWYRKDNFVNQNKHNQKYGGDIYSKILDICRISPSSLMIRKDVFIKIGLFNKNIRVCEDYELSLRFSYIYKIGYLNRMLIIKRAIEDNSLSKNIRFIESIRLEILENFLLNYNKLLKKDDKIKTIDEIDRKRKIVNNGINKIKPSINNL